MPHSAGTVLSVLAVERRWIQLILFSDTKESFGNVVQPVYVGFRIHHLPTYERLCAQWELEHPDYVERYRRYFLRYRGGQFERKVMH